MCDAHPSSFMCRSLFEEKPLEVGSRKWLIWQLDIHTSRIVRGRDRSGATRGPQCSHFYSRCYLIIRFDLRNCNAMCAACNIRHNSDPFPYLNFMQEHYGADVISELHQLRMSLEKVMDDELRKLLDEYKRIA